MTASTATSELAARLDAFQSVADAFVRLMR